ncbi:hypothetical protein NDI43_21720 [Microcoleus vaginatus GB2-A3]
MKIIRAGCLIIPDSLKFGSCGPDFPCIAIAPIFPCIAIALNFPCMAI